MTERQLEKIEIVRSTRMEKIEEDVNDMLAEGWDIIKIVQVETKLTFVMGYYDYAKDDDED